MVCVVALVIIISWVVVGWKDWECGGQKLCLSICQSIFEWVFHVQFEKAQLILGDWVKTDINTKKYVHINV